MPVQYTANFHDYKNENFQMENIDCGYTLEPPLTISNDLCLKANI